MRSPIAGPIFPSGLDEQDRLDVFTKTTLAGQVVVRLHPLLFLIALLAIVVLGRSPGDDLLALATSGHSGDQPVVTELARRRAVQDPDPVVSPADRA